MATALKPVIAGQRLKSRKRDVKEKFDSSEFRDNLVEGIKETGDIAAASKWLENNPEQLNYRQYAEEMFDVLIAGGLLAPGGSIVNDGADRNPFASFEIEVDADEQRKAIEVIRALVRRYKYLSVSLEESVTKILGFLAGYTPENLQKLAFATAYLLSMTLIKVKPLKEMLKLDKAISSGVALSFVTDVFTTWLKNRTILQVGMALRKEGFEHEMHLLFPIGKQTPQDINAYFAEREGLADLGKWYLLQKQLLVKADLTAEMTQHLAQGETAQETLVERVRSIQLENKIPESAISKLLWTALMESEEWSKKPEILFEQALRHIQKNMTLLKGFTKSERAQVVLMVAMQEHAFVHQNFLKIFSKFCLLMYKGDVLDEDSIVLWYKTDHSQKGKNSFLKEMNHFIEWFENTEEEDA